MHERTPDLQASAQSIEPPQEEVIGRAYDSDLARLTENAVKNVSALEQAGPIGEALVPVYLAALDESPGLQSVEIHPMDHVEYGGVGIASIVPIDDIMVREKVEIVTGSTRPYTKWLKRFPMSAGIIAERFGLAPEDMDEVTFAQITLAHELGHMHIDQAEMSGEPQALKINAEDRRAKHEMPVARKAPSELVKFLRTPAGLIFWHKKKDDYAQAGINSRRELITAQEAAYTARPSEVAADEFAAKIMKRTWAHTTQDREQIAEGDIVAREFGAARHYELGTEGNEPLGAVADPTKE